jgi:putative ABC transport system permease protein
VKSGRPSLAVRTIVAGYRVGLSLYPREFRQRFAGDVVDAFSDDITAVHEHRGLLAVLLRLPGAARDLVMQALGERLEASGFTSPSGSSAGPRPPSPPRSVTRMFSSLLQDFRFAARMLVRSPAFTLVVAATLALAIGATTAVFTAVNAIALRPLPFPSPEELVLLWYSEQDAPPARNAVGGVNVADWRAMNASFTDIGTWRSWRATLAGVDVPQSLVGARVSHEYATALAIQPLYGRTLDAADDAVGAPNRVMLGYDLWRQQFGGRRETLGTHIRLNGAEWEVIGILEPGFTLPRVATTEVLSALRLDISTISRGSNNLSALARLRPGVSLAAARADMLRIDEALEAEYPDTNRGVRTWVRSLHEDTVADISVSLYMLLAAGGFVLVVAVANVAGLLVARASTREEELAVRAALGAGRGRIVRLMLSEALVLAALGGAGGLLVAQAATRALLAVAPPSIPRLAEITIDYRVLLFAALVTLVSGLLFGAVPAFRRQSDAVIMRGARGSTARGAENMRRVLVTAQVAVALVLLIGAGLLANSFWRLLNEDPGLQPDGILAARLALGAEYDSSEGQQAFFTDLLEQIAARPEVDETGAAFLLPFAGGSVSGSFDIPGQPESTSDSEPYAYVQTVSDSYFDLVRTPLTRGRKFNEQDNWTGQRVAIINETTARLYWPDADPLGQTIQLHVTLDDQERDLERTIVGVVADAKQWALDRDPEPFIYAPFRQYPVASMYLMVRPRGAPTDFVPTLREIVKQADPELALYRVAEMSEFVGRTVERQRFSMVLLTGFAAVGLVLGCVGIYGLIAFNVARRTREIGLRMALGSSHLGVLTLVLRDTSRMVVLGIAAGLGVSLWVTQFIESMLHGVSATDVPTIASMSLLLLLLSLVAGFLPARRAARVDPAVALRSD